MEVTKVKRLNEKTTVLWRAPNGRHHHNSELEECPDVPHDAFLDQFATVEADLKARIGFGKKFEGGFTLTGISMTRNNGGRRQFTVSANMNLGWGDTGTSLPFLLEPDSEKPSTADNVLSPNELKNIEELFDQALKYAQGERHQATLALEDKEPDGPAFPEGEKTEELAGAGAAH